MRVCVRKEGASGKRVLRAEHRGMFSLGSSGEAHFWAEIQCYSVIHRVCDDELQFIVCDWPWRHQYKVH